MKIKTIYTLDDVIAGNLPDPDEEFADLFADFGDLLLLVEEGTNRIVYQSHVFGDMAFCFDLFEEVGRYYQDDYKAIIKKYDLKIETYDNPSDEYCHGYYDRLKQTI
jgi:hypothetical protein